jgi:hypothetical protein
MPATDPPFIRFAALVRDTRKAQRDAAKNRADLEANLDKATRWIFANHRDDMTFKPLVGLVQLMRHHQVDITKTRRPTCLQRDQIRQYEEKVDTEARRVLTHKQPCLPLCNPTPAETVSTYTPKRHR